MNTTLTKEEMLNHIEKELYKELENSDKLQWSKTYTSDFRAELQRIIENISKEDGCESLTYVGVRANIKPFVIVTFDFDNEYHDLMFVAR